MGPGHPGVRTACVIEMPNQTASALCLHILTSFEQNGVSLLFRRFSLSESVNS